MLECLVDMAMGDLDIYDVNKASYGLGMLSIEVHMGDFGDG